MRWSTQLTIALSVLAGRLIANVDDAETRNLRDEQHERAASEERLADQSEHRSDESAHRRRADKARYLEEKLEEHVRSERED